MILSSKIFLMIVIWISLFLHVSGWFSQSFLRMHNASAIYWTGSNINVYGYDKLKLNKH